MNQNSKFPQSNVKLPGMPFNNFSDFEEFDAQLTESNKDIITQFVSSPFTYLYTSI